MAKKRRPRHVKHDLQIEVEQQGEGSAPAPAGARDAPSNAPGYDEQWSPDEFVLDDGTLSSDETIPPNPGSISESDLGFLRVDTATDRVRLESLDPELAGNSLEIGTDAGAVMDQIDDYTTDRDVLDDFADRQRFTAGSDELLTRLTEHHSKTPGLSGNDVDAAWEDADASGEETVGSSTPTPDQDVVEELGEALGITYSDNEPLNTYDKLLERDRHRWELNPESSIEEDLGEYPENGEDEGDFDDNI
ncbi:MAG TPA: DUF6335 family protein [Anaerolineales bacterium]